MGTEDQALLSNRDGVAVFRFRQHTIRFRVPYSLERYTEVKTWDNGYLAVMAKYAHNEVPEEEYNTAGLRLDCNHVCFRNRSICYLLG